MNEADFWRKVREADTRRFGADNKAVVDPATEDSTVIPDPNAHRPLPNDDVNEEAV